VQELAQEGRRVLMLGHSQLDASDDGLPTDLVPVALIALIEEIRPDAADTLAYLRDQGVIVKIISGDNPVTVGAIARRLGLDIGEVCDARTLGDEPSDMTEALTKTTVFGRVTPEQKRSIVQSLQESGHVVAMTGDGVNDALALKRSDIGIAMNNGAPATKAVAQLILLDGQFSHLPSVISEGRRVIGNVERVANLFLAKNAMSFIAIISAAILSMPFPLLPRHLTLLSSITIGIPAFFLALGPNPRRFESGFLKRILIFAVPAGAIAGITVVVADYVARGKWGVSDGTKCSVVNVAKNAVNQDCWRVGSAATFAVLMVFFWILLLLARPLRAWKLALVLTMSGLGVIAFTVPFARDFFNFNLPTELLIESALIGGAGILGIEGVRRVQGRLTR
jgi:cation-transporting ATPase E